MSTPAQPLSDAQVAFITEYIKQKKSHIALLEEDPDSAIYEFPARMDEVDDLTGKPKWVNTEYVANEDFDPLRVLLSPVEEGSAKHAKGVKFKFAEIKYVHPKLTATGEKVNEVGELLLEGPTSKSDRGAQLKVNEQNQREELVIRSEINETKKADEKWLNVLDMLYCSLVAYTHIKAVGFGFAKNARIGPDSHNGFKPLIYTPRDKEGNVTGRPSMFYKLEYRRDGAKTTCYTTFSNPLDSNMSYKLLINSSIEHKPVIHVRRIFSANAKSFQFSLKSAVITDIKPAGATVLQTATIAQLNAADPELRARFARQMAAVERAQAGASSSAPPCEDEGEDTEQPESTLAGLSSSRFSEDLDLEAEESDSPPAAPVHRRGQFSLGSK